MSTIFDYLEWRGDIPFSADEFNDVDNLILAKLSYTEFDGIVPANGRGISLKKAAEAFWSTHTREQVRTEPNPIHRTPLLMDGMLSGERFKGTILSDYVNIIDTEQDFQMSAITFKLSDGTAYIAFRGTDTTIVGWKEDFNMSYQPETEGHRQAIKYLNRVGARLKCPIRVGGHSKGGNFAVYASAFCDQSVRDTIIDVYTNDGPGFRKEVMKTESYRNILPKVTSIVPGTSVIGMLLGNKVKHRIIKSNAFGFMQHDGLTWQVQRKGFVPSSISGAGKFIMKTQREWLRRIDDERREAFVESLFSMIESTGMGDFDVMSDNKIRSAERILSAASAMPAEKQIELVKTFGELVLSGGQTAISSIIKMIDDFVDKQ